MNKKMKNKGFTLVELLGVIVIIGILSSIAVVSLSRYKQKAKQMDYDALAKSAYNAYETYAMKKNYTKISSIGQGGYIELGDLYDEQLLDNIQDPGNKESSCSGKVTALSDDGTLENANKFIVYLCCSNYSQKYTFGETEKKEDIDPSECTLLS